MDLSPSALPKADCEADNPIGISPRDRRFSQTMLERRWWVGGNPYVSALFNGLSVVFPRGESFFIDTLKPFRTVVPTRLGREITAFIRQEAIHSREHIAFNLHLRTAAYRLERLEEKIDQVVDHLSDKSPLTKLSATIALEHITAIIAHEVIANPAHLANADPEQRKLWLWHASEEIEHKGVAFDTWLHMTRDLPKWKGWWIRCSMMLTISLGFTKNRVLGMVDLLQQDGIGRAQALWGVFRMLALPSGIFCRTLLPWLKFFSPGFHPWQEDDRHLIGKAESEYEDAILPIVTDGKTSFPERRKHRRFNKAA
jgi:hypothetical protein